MRQNLTAPAAPAFEAYREAFVPSEAFPEPHAILAVAIVCAETQEEAGHLAKTLDLVRVPRLKREQAPLPSPEEVLASDFTPQDEAVVPQYRPLQAVGTPEAVRDELERRVWEAGATR